MKRVTLLCLLVSVFATVVVLSEPVKVFPDLWDQDALKYIPNSPGYPILAVNRSTRRQHLQDVATYSAVTDYCS